jgi:nitrogen regulatory protein P-II 1
VVTEADQERVIQAISDAVRTETAGSGKIFVERVTDAIRIRTGESGTDAV